MLRKILIVLPTDNIGGAEKVLKLIAKYYVEKSNSFVVVFFLKKKSTNSWDDLLTCKNISLNYGNFKSTSLGLVAFIFFVLRLGQLYSIFSSQTLINGFIGFLIKIKLIKTKFFIARESTTIFNRFSGIKLLKYKLFYYLGYEYIDLLICQTKFMKNQFEKKLYSISKKINVEIIPNPIKLLKIEEDKIDLNFNNEYIVSAGRLIREKGFDILIDAFVLLKNDYTNIKLVILGEGPMREQLEKKIIDLNLSNKVFLLGHVKNVLPYFKYSRICVVSSIIEGFPNVILEMMSQNTKVVSTKCAGGIDSLKGVFIAEPNNINSLKEAIKKCLKENTRQNRFYFDNELKLRDISFFIKKIDSYLKK